jgi:long-chain fatty acid transport protein
MLARSTLCSGHLLLQAITPYNLVRTVIEGQIPFTQEPFRGAPMISRNYACRAFSARASAVVLSLLFVVSSAFGQVGHTLSGVGPVDQAWSGAGTANPQDLLGAIHWNPATLTGFKTTQVSLGFQLLSVSSDLSSAIGANAQGPGNPPVELSGTTAGEAGPFPMPAVAYVRGIGESNWTFGVAGLVAGGFGTDYAESSPPGGNPLNFSQRFGGFGRIHSEFAMMQLVPTIAYKLSDNFSIGFAPTIDYALLEVGPFPATSPGPAGYPEAPSTGSVGLGFQVGVQLETESGLSLGASFKSKQNFSEFEWDRPEGGTFSFDLDYPMIISGGIGYSKDRLELAADVRYIDYENTNGFQEAKFGPGFAVTGFGWQSIVNVAVGAQYALTDKLQGRAGYSFNDNPIRDRDTFFNTPANAIITNRVSGGFSYLVSEKVTLSAGAQYGLENDIEGTMFSPFSPMPDNSAPGTSVKSTLSTFFMMFGLNFKL